MSEARNQLFETSYAGTTIRSVSKGCGIAVGTVYNYFKSKDLLIAAVVLEDWIEYVEKMKTGTANTQNDKEFFCCIVSLIREFALKYKKLFNDTNAMKNYTVSSAARHPHLRSQIAQIITLLLEKRKTEDLAFTSEFIAEAVITWSLTDVPFETIFTQIKKLL